MSKIIKYSECIRPFTVTLMWHLIIFPESLFLWWWIWCIIFEMNQLWLVRHSKIEKRISRMLLMKFMNFRLSVELIFWNLTFNFFFQTRARVDVHRKDNAGSLEKAITIYGNPENCTNACKRILEVMQEEANNTNKGFVSNCLCCSCHIVMKVIHSVLK